MSHPLPRPRALIAGSSCASAAARTGEFLAICRCHGPIGTASACKPPAGIILYHAAFTNPRDRRRYNPDETQERCLPTADVPLRTAKMVKAAAQKSGTYDPFAMNHEHAEEMLKVFKQFKKEAIEREVTLASGWVAIYKKRKRGDGGDVTLNKPGEQPLRSAADVRRKLGLPFEPKSGKQSADAAIEE